MSLSRVRTAIAAATVSLLAACGGGGGDETPVGSAPAPTPPSASAAPITRLVVAGDSLADVGTFGLKATVQSASNPAGYPIYPEVVSQQLGTGALCSYFTSSDEGGSFATRPACTNFAVAGADIVNPVVRDGDDSPFSLKKQLESALSANGGAWKPGDLLVMDAGANDAAGLADTYLGAQRGGATDKLVFAALLGQQLSGSTIDNALSQPNGGSVAATLYMQQLARTWWAMVKANALDQGATRVVLVNIPDITLTPRLRDVVAGAATDLGAGGAADFQAAVRGWITTFNSELAAQAAGDSRVVIVDYFGEFTAEVAGAPAAGLTNTTQAACPATVDFPQCTDAALDAAPPAGAVAGWWKTWLFSDRFHPSPRGHELLGAAVLRAIQAAGWR
ncbi:SGNH/GDSL hydrolase family protein [Ramlibacter algicola]|uniref:Phospholipase n=1 Tax=Ramlibacter algicola TaxID=2795217 RepID=A0A934Q080_9BURK|nr:SGNH/GDSL hydrolase family protein [Ramlibacter algicola]MBK0392775.1 phospholipase [Ramlibacter algicola]